MIRGVVGADSDWGRLIKHAIGQGLLTLLGTLPFTAVFFWAGLQGGRMGIDIAQTGLIFIALAWLYMAIRQGKKYQKKQKTFAYKHAFLHALIFLLPVPILRLLQLGQMPIRHGIDALTPYQWILMLRPLCVALAAAVLIAFITKQNTQTKDR